MSQPYFHVLGFGKKPALFISDMQVAYTDPNYPRGMAVDKEIAIIQQLIVQCHQKKVPIFFSVIAFNDNQIKKPNLWQQKIPGLNDLILGTANVALDKRLNFREGIDHLIIKQFTSAFFDTDLKQQLNQLAIDTLIITGCSTSGCVRATAIDALQNGFRPIVVADGVADRWPKSHEQSLLELSAKYADVINSNEVINFLQGAHE